MLSVNKYKNQFLLNSFAFFKIKTNFFNFEFKKNNKISRKLCLIVLVHYYLFYNNFFISKNLLLFYLKFFLNLVNLVFYKTLKFCLK